jgi:hypothetical protein
MVTVSKGRLILLLWGNAKGYFELKPIYIYRLLNLRALRGCNKISLPLIWWANKKSWVTQALFEDWFKIYFCQAVKSITTASVV